ncbi:DUF2637 domain-containing protein [Nocardia puris]|uniref:Homeodomain-like domain-containing protein n=1 Tax=Nocardia puris TaxID=208602 RepID=A0A366E3Y1_9NOCA|nr:DUF2637 domain-containing protein [Nocardia puris]RBO97080.1 Homeodomain-like domain-containing protein [Nocardia puris]
MDAADRVSVGMRWARWSAVVIIVAVGVAAFRLSFATLEDLARLAHIPAGDAWLFPVIVDGTILLATAGVLVCPDRRERRFFVSVLVVGALVSVAGNSLHAVAAGRDLPGWAAALVAGIAPISLLADTHGLALLFRAAQRHSAPVIESAPMREPVPVAVAEPVSVPAATVVEPKSGSRGGKRSGGSSADRAARAVVLAASGRSVAAIATELGVSQGTVRKYLKPAKPSAVEPVSNSESESVPASVSSPVSVVRVSPVRSSRPAPAQQAMLPIAVPVGGN